MRAAWYERQGAAAQVLQVSEMPEPGPGLGEVRVRVGVSGINPGDTKKRRGWLGSAMPYPRVIPHSDGAGIIDCVGEGVDAKRLGQRVWIYGAQSYRPFGTAADYVVVPDRQAVFLPTQVSDGIGACLGIPGITAHRALFADGPISNRVVLIHGALGAVGSLAAQLAHWAGATVIGTVRHQHNLPHTNPAVTHSITLDQPDPASAIRELAPRGVDRIVEVSLSSNAELDAAVIATGGVIAAYSTHTDQTPLPFWPLLFANATIQLLGSDDFPASAKHNAARDLTAAAADVPLNIPIRGRFPLEHIAAAHDQVDTARPGRTLIEFDTDS